MQSPPEKKKTKKITESPIFMSMQTVRMLLTATARGKICPRSGLTDWITMGFNGYFVFSTVHRSLCTKAFFPFLLTKKKSICFLCSIKRKKRKQNPSFQSLNDIYFYDQMRAVI